jgi:DNA-binding LacI/PurR family transcriptional regulator
LNVSVTAFVVEHLWSIAKQMEDSMSDSTPKYVLVERYIKDAINSGRIQDRLPGERSLAKTLGVSYMTARKAIHNLVEQGLLYKVPTKGAFVNTGSQKKPSRTIGYYLDSSIAGGISSPYYALLFSAIEKEASAHDYSVIYFSDNTDSRLRSTLVKLDGVIASCLPRVEKTIQVIKQSVPVVVIDNSSVDKSIPSVIIDDFNAYVRSVDYVASLGHRRIGFMCGLADSDVGKNRFAGYAHGLKKHKIAFDKTLVFRGNYSFESGIDGAEYFQSLKRPPSAIVCANDQMALGAIKTLDSVGVRVPEDISVIGFDDIEIASQITPALTTVAAPVQAIASYAFDALSALMQGRAPTTPHTALSAELIVRNTCTALNRTAVA